jgi:ATP synthase protein I
MEIQGLAMPRWKKYTLAGVNPKKDLRRSKELLELSTLGLTLVFSTFIGLAIGLGLDKVLKTRPHLMIVFLVLGIVAGFVNLFRSVRRGDKDCSSKD